MKLRFYTTSGCTLCEQTLDMLFAESSLAGLQLEVIEIAEDEDLVARFGATLPVLEHDAGELHSPFSLADVQMWLGRVR